MNIICENDEFSINELVSVYNSPLNMAITNSEVTNCIKMLKNGKACGYDQVINEFLKYSNNIMCDLYTRLFNLILSKGLVPSDWAIGIIISLYKNKGNVNDVDSYRGITILSCLGKLFMLVINERLKIFIHSNNLPFEEQTGFRDVLNTGFIGFSTLDHIFALDFIKNYYVSRKKILYIAFVDYRKAFASVGRILLWRKLLKLNISGSVLNVIHNLYDQAKSCVMYGESLSEFFVSNVGVRQEENLSPMLFAIFLNDIASHMNERYNGLVGFCDD